MESGLEQLDSDLRENDDHVKILVKHLDKVKQEIQFTTTKVLHAKHKETPSELQL